MRHRSLAPPWLALFAVGAVHAGCVPWNELHGPTLGVGVRHAGDAWTPEVTAGYAWERFKQSHGYGLEGRASWEPWRNAGSLAAIVRGRFTAAALAIGPAVVVADGRARPGLVIETQLSWPLGASSTCRQGTNSAGCLDTDDTVYPDWGARLGGGGTWVHDGPVRPRLGVELLVSSFYLRHGHSRPPDND